MASFTRCDLISLASALDSVQIACRLRPDYQKTFLIFSLYLQTLIEIIRAKVYDIFRLQFNIFWSLGNFIRQ